MMILHHVIDGVAMHVPKILNAFGAQLPMLISASSYATEPRLPKFRKDIRQASSSLIFDSGVLGFAKRNRPEWVMEGHDWVVAKGLELGANRIATVDVPCEPEILAKLGMTVWQAIDITVANSHIALDDQRLEGKRIFTVQGWSLDQRKRCLERLIPLIEFDANAWIGNGSTCMLTPKDGLYLFYEWLCSELPDRHIHAWGIAQPAWSVVLAKLGVSSGDSATAGVAAAFNEQIDQTNGKRIPLPHGSRNKIMATCDALRNLWALQLAYENLEQIPQTTECLNQKRLF